MVKMGDFIVSDSIVRLTILAWQQMYNKVMFYSSKYPGQLNFERLSVGNQHLISSLIQPLELRSGQDERERLLTNPGDEG